MFEKQSRLMEDVVKQVTVRDFEIAYLRAQLQLETGRRQETEATLKSALQEIILLERRLHGEAGESSNKKARVEARSLEEEATVVPTASTALPVKGRRCFRRRPPCSLLHRRGHLH